MIVTMRSQLSGTRDGVDWPARGGQADLPDDEAQQLIGNGLAVAGAVELATGGPLTTADMTDDAERAVGPDSSARKRR